MPATADVVVVGAGFAGAATAFHLARLGVRRVVIIEREPLPGSHASGRNAGIGRQTALSPSLTPLAAEGLGFLREPPLEWRTASLLRSCGTLILAEGDDAATLRSGLASDASSWLDRDEVERLVPATAEGAFDGAVYGPDDGVADIAALLQGYLRSAQAGGVRLLTGQRVVRIGKDENRIASVETERETLITPTVVNAAGAWAGEIAALAGATAPPLRPCRRHLFHTTPLNWVDRDWPVVWDVTHGLYFRPEPPGLLLSPCDETDHPPGPVAVDADALEALAYKMRWFMPRLADVAVGHAWAGLRTLTPDGNFVIGRDPEVEGLVWCAGLGGHGMTTSAAVGRLAAEAVLGRPAEPDHSPERFARRTTAQPSSRC